MSKQLSCVCMRPGVRMRARAQVGVHARVHIALVAFIGGAVPKVGASAARIIIATIV